jgi:hypothetical protein
MISIIGDGPMHIVSLICLIICIFITGSGTTAVLRAPLTPQTGLLAAACCVSCMFSTKTVIDDAQKRT